MNTSHECFNCQFDGLGYPCRYNGALDTDAFVTAYLGGIGDQIESDADKDNELHWSFDCLWALQRHDPEVAFTIVMALISRLTTHWQAIMIAAGPLEDLIAQAPDLILPLVEEQALKSPRFRWVLTGVWPQGNQGTKAWKRVEAARAGILTLDESQDMPPT